MMMQARPMVPPMIPIVTDDLSFSLSGGEENVFSAGKILKTAISQSTK